MTIEVSDEIGEKLLSMSRLMNQQDRRCTADPYFYQIQTRTKIWRQDMEGAVVVVLDRDSNEIDELTPELIKDLMEGDNEPVPDCVSDACNKYNDKSQQKKADKAFTKWLNGEEDGLDDWLAEKGYRLTTYDRGHKYENAFFTEQACEDHIRLNRYHYDDPKSYVQHGFRNPEMQLIQQFLRDLTKHEYVSHQQ